MAKKTYLECPNIFSKLCTWVSWGHRCPPPPSTAFTHLSPKCLPPPQHTAQIVQSTEAQMNFQMNGRKGELVAQMNGQAGGLPRWINRSCCPRTTSRLIVHLNRQEDECCCPNEWTGNEFVAHKLEASLLAAASFRGNSGLEEGNQLGKSPPDDRRVCRGEREVYFLVNVFLKFSLPGKDW